MALCSRLFSDGNSALSNLRDDADAGRIDFFVHLGDHAYDMGHDDDRRGDGYMNAIQTVAAQLPWIPLMGNHEWTATEGWHRYLNQTFRPGARAAGPTQCGHERGCASSDQSVALRHLTLSKHEGTSADSALGALLTRTSARHHNSGTSRWFSVDIGLVHIAALDSMVWFQDPHDPSGTGKDWEAQEKLLGPAQLAWLDRDLAAVNRTKTPWVLVTAHAPMYCSSITLGINGFSADLSPSNLSTLLDHAPDEGDDGTPLQLTAEQRARLPPGKDYKGCIGMGEGLASRAREAVEPLLLQHGVDMFVAGHEHNFESTYPVKRCGLNSSECYIGKDLRNPQAPVHVVVGQGGTGGADHFGNVS